MIDPDDVEFISQWDWAANDSGYAVRTARDGLKRVDLRMHRALAERWGWTIQGLEVDHRNGDKLDNRRANLRPATREENRRNRGPQANNRSGHKGVSWNKKQRKWEAKIWTHGRCVHLGMFAEIADAAEAYAAAAKEHHGVFARTEAERMSEDKLKPAGS